MSELANAVRTIEKAKETLERCEMFFAHQAHMNAAAHMSERVMYPPIHSAVQATLQSIATFKRTTSEESQ